MVANDAEKYEYFTIFSAIDLPHNVRSISKKGV